jgi:hypothetical protein
MMPSIDDDTLTHSTALIIAIGAIARAIKAVRRWSPAKGAIAWGAKAETNPVSRPII